MFLKGKTLVISGKGIIEVNINRCIERNRKGNSIEGG